MSKSTTRSRLVRAGLATGAVATVLLATATPAFAVNTPMTLSPTTGPTGGGTAITATGTALLTGITNVAGRFTTAATCPTTFGTTTTANPVVAVTKVNDTTATFTSPSFVVAPATYRVCLYGNATTAGTPLASTTALIGNGAFGPVTAAAPVLNITAGPVTAGGTVTATATDFLSAVTTVGATLSTGACPTTYNSTAPNLVATAVKDSAGGVATVTMPSGLVAGSQYNVCFYNGTTAGTSALVGATSNTYSALPSVTLSPGVGPTGGTNTITATAGNAFLSGITPGVFFTRANCPTNYIDDADTEAATTVTKISNTKAAITVPAAVALTGSEATAAYRVCIYNGTTGAATLISAPGAYTIAPILSVTGVSPVGGPAQGGSRVTVTGTGFPTGAGAVISASIGGAPLVDITPVNATSFQGTTTAHAPGTGSVSVTTAAGTKSGGTFTFSYGITVTPNTAPNTGPGASVYLDVLGAGFSELEAGFALGTNLPADAVSANPHVYLVDGAYNPTNDGAGGKLVGPVDDCNNVVVISDVELICLLDLTNGITNVATPAATGAPVPMGTYTVTVVDDGTVGASPLSASIISSGSTFTVAPY
jgi:hypothetical protein